MSEIEIFDLDGVLTRRDTMARLVVRRLRQFPVRFFPALPIYMLAVISPAGSSLRAALNRALVRLALEGMDEPAYKEAARCLGEFFATNRSLRNDWAIAACKAASLRGRTIVATASDEVLARSFLDTAGLDQVELLASRVAVRSGVLVLEHHNVGGAKLRNVQETGINLSEALFYTDSLADLPLAKAMGRVVLVNPSKRIVAPFRRAVRDIKVRNWPPDHISS